MLKSKSKKKSVYPFKPQFYNINVGCKGVYITRTCLHNAYCKHTAFLSFFLLNIVKLGFTGVNIFSFFLLIFVLKNILWVLVRTASAVLTCTHDRCF